MGEIQPKRCEGRELTKDQLADASGGDPRRGEARRAGAAADRRAGEPRYTPLFLPTSLLLTRSCGQAITSRLASTSYARAASVSSPRRRPKLSWLLLCPTARAWRRSARLPWGASSWATKSTCRTCRPCCAASSRCEPPQPWDLIRICPWDLSESANELVLLVSKHRTSQQ